MNPDEVLGDWESWANEFQAATAEPIRQAVNDGGKAGVARADDLGLAATWDVTNPYVEDWLSGYTMKFAERINATLHDDLKTTLTDGLNAGEGMRDLESRVLSVMGDEASEYRAEMIARTESHRAEQMGELEMWKQSGIAMKKVWQANPDACDFCDAMDGAEADMDEPFLAMGDVISLPAEDDEKAGPTYTVGNYEDVETASLHPNCRCSVTWLEA